MTGKSLGPTAAGIVVAVAVAVLMTPTPPAWGQLPPIEHGTIGVTLQPIATGMGAPDYAISPPNDDRLFVVEQNGQLRYIQNGALSPTVSLDLATVPGGLGPFNAGNANDERGFLGLAFHPNFNTPGAIGAAMVAAGAMVRRGTRVSIPARSARHARTTFVCVI